MKTYSKKPEKYELEREMRKRGGQYVKSLRLANDPKMTQRELAEKLGVPFYTYISMVESGTARVPLDEMANWAEALGVDLQEFESKYMPRAFADNVVPINFSSETKGANSNSGGNVLEDAYPEYMREALLGVVRKIMHLVSMIERHPERYPNMGVSENILYIMFDPRHPKVKFPANLIEKYHDEVTITLQQGIPRAEADYEWWHSLTVDDDCFHVTLFFDGVETPISVPWESILCFADETAQFGLGVGSFDTDDFPDQCDIIPLFPSDNDRIH
tara:strand:+ start:1117 stop:1935 length:819 start_codon:yes stop_codon:yes gene_type:complete